MYHSISSGNSLRVPKKEFEAHMKWLHDNGYQTLTPKEAYLMLTQDKKPSEKCVLITFDDGYTDNYQDAYPVLKKYGMKATIFMIGKSIGHRHHLTEEQMKEMAQHGISIESHTIDHVELNGLTPQQQQSEMADSKKLFDHMFHQQTTIISYPVGRYNEETLKAAEKTGYQMGVTTEPGAASRDQGMYALHRVRVSPGMSGSAFGAYIESMK
ncbi:Polysaccharide deacetylase [Bacillus subtilis]|uniref:Polysaccharide deacetylase n=2 Tax=Bacillus subtilis TaxID=1423 RepID=A0AAP1DZV7_BACIU|nr:Polysaccharide deacetylase [Bacillus subtilis]